MNNAIQSVRTASHDLEHARQHLRDALSSVEKPENRTKIESTLGVVENAISSVEQTINNYSER